MIVLNEDFDGSLSSDITLDGGASLVPGKTGNGVLCDDFGHELHVAVSPTPTLTVGFWCNITHLTISPFSIRLVLFRADDSDQDVHVSYVNDNTEVSVKMGATSTLDSATVDLSGWHYLETRAKSDDPDGLLEFRVDGTTVLSYQGDTEGGNYFEGRFVGNGRSSALFDQMYVADDLQFRGYVPLLSRTEVEVARSGRNVRVQN